MKAPNKNELMHLQLQAVLRKHTFPDLQYLGIREGEHYYCIAGNEVPVSMIEGLDSED